MVSGVFGVVSRGLFTPYTIVIGIGSVVVVSS